MKEGPLDPILLEVMWNRLMAIAEEQAQALFHAVFNTAAGEAEDFASTIHDKEGNLIAQSISSGTLSMLTGMAKSIKHILGRYPPETLQPGDIIICNDPWLMSGHKFDVTLVKPVHDSGGRLVGFTATSAHVPDIGGVGFGASSRDTYDEGLTLIPLKFFKRGEPNQDLLDVIQNNVRSPDQVLGDLMAQVAANEVGAAKLLEFMTEYGLGTLDSLARTIISKSEAEVRKAIIPLPDGVYSHHVLMDGWEEPLKVAVAMRIQGDSISADFQDTASQVPIAINCVLNVTYGYTVHAIKSALVPHVPNNEGFFRPIHVTAPEGSLLNPRHPAPVMARHLLYPFVSAAVFGALAQVVPDRVIADAGNNILAAFHGKDQRGRPFSYWFATRTGMGARPSKDGYSGTNWPASVGTVPIEIVENVSPLFVERKGFVPDSGGPGKFRGGCDQEIALRVRSPEAATISCMFERTKFPALGYAGGWDGGLGKVEAGSRSISPKERCLLQPGEIVAIRQGGGGGFHPPEFREPELVLQDVVNELVSLESAYRDYKVCLRQQGDGYAIDWEQTRRLRGEGQSEVRTGRI